MRPPPECAVVVGFTKVSNDVFIDGAFYAVELASGYKDLTY